MRPQILTAILLLSAVSQAAFTYQRTIDLAGTVNEFSNPIGLEFADGRLYVADSEKSFIYVFGALGEYDYKIGGPGFTDSALNAPKHIRFDSGKLYIPDSGNSLVKIYTGYSLSSRLGQGLSQMASPSGAAVGGDIVYVSDSTNHRLYMYDRETRLFIDELGMQGQGDGQFNRPSGIFIHEGLMYVSDAGNDRVSVLDLNFTPIRSIGRGQGGVSLDSPGDVFVGNEVYVADTGNDRVVVFTKDGYPLETLGSRGDGPYQFDSPEGILVVGNTLYVADSGNGRVQVFSITASEAGEGILQEISDANQSVRGLLALAAAGAKLNLSVESDASSLLSQAVLLHSRGSYGDASAIAAQAGAEAESAKAALSQLIVVRVRSMLDSASQKIARYDGVSLPQDLQLAKSAALNKVADSRSKLNSMNYAAAVDAALLAAGAADMLEAQYGEWRAQQDEERSGAASESVGMEISALEARLAALKRTNAEFRQNADFSYLEGLIATAKSSLSAGNLADADSSIPVISAELMRLELEVNATSGRVESALSLINSTENEIAGAEREKILIAPNLASARIMLAGAKSKVYDSPADAEEEAKQALSLARQEVSNARVLSIAIMVLGAFAIAFVVALGAALYFLYRRKKRKGL